MRHRDPLPRRLRNAVSSLGVALLCLVAARGGSAAGIRVGVAQADITPPIGGLTTGYSDARPTDGVHDPLSARVLVLASGQSTVALAVCDLCIFNSAWLHEQMPALGVDRLLLLNTHTHAGPKLDQDDFPSAQEPWRRTVERRVLDAIRRAKEGMFEASFLAEEGRLQLGYNRLVPKGQSAVTHFDNPDHIPYGPVDPTVGVIRVTDAAARTRAVLVAYACHPVVLGPHNRKLSADYPGVTRRLVEAKLGGDAVCVFIQGGGGDINPLMMARGEDRGGDFQVVERVGSRLADEVLEVLKGMGSRPGRSDRLTVGSKAMRVASRWKPGEEVALGTTALLINDDIGIVTMPGEPFHRFQVEFSRQAGVPHAYLFGYCCDGPYSWPSYLPDLMSAARGGYGASNTTQAEVGAGERLVNAGLVQLLTLRGRLVAEPRRDVPDRP
ncbi:neutral/alkaline non-lysosomal ceramidase N-terminal domain-containing protein [Aquisphaera insulae]|uniref:neutral/alkaline non-lysosomal ceramidase N-terminal domain-containing protein n=1 Tax=Aquisphaera insulae TaxID=2712864 RepID=UPI0013EA7488|nr:neutral/alkaline non-lysosomal ceramidase N-terminal domain-containing protein [Aquisphaera insulae]